MESAFQVTEMPLAAWVAVIGVVLTVLLQFAGIVAFAATQKVLIAGMRDAIAELKAAVAEMAHQTQTIDRRLWVLEDRAGHARSSDP